MTIKELMRTGHVKRWHIVRVGREQTIAEHMYRVWLICREIGIRSNIEWHRMVQMEMIALTHDIPEVVMGDIPTPTKLVIEKNTSCLEDLEARIDGAGTRFIEEVRESDPILADIVKLADMIEAVAFLKEEAIGSHAEAVRHLIKDQYYEKVKEAERKYPESHHIIGIVRDTFATLCL
jgi:5'-deoxynucleotidase YfbR-like HD superfamily hydrolase